MKGVLLKTKAFPDGTLVKTTRFENGSVEKTIRLPDSVKTFSAKNGDNYRLKRQITLVYSHETKNGGYSPKNQKDFARLAQIKEAWT